MCVRYELNYRHMQYSRFLGSLRAYVTGCDLLCLNLNRTHRRSPS
jgi:hypothetical protein